MTQTGLNAGYMLYNQATVLIATFIPLPAIGTLWDIYTPINIQIAVRTFSLILHILVTRVSCLILRVYLLSVYNSLNCVVQ